MHTDSYFRHPGESRDPAFPMDGLEKMIIERTTAWIPAFAGMTMMSGALTRIHADAY
jgi:hypothetical protein